MNTDFGAGKEPGETLKSRVNWYDYGWRMYNSSIGRFHNIDPLSEAFSSQTPYAYAANNPVLFIDYMGLSPQVGADGLTNEQWIESSRPGTSSEIADSYRTENRNLGIDQNKLSGILGNALNGDVNSLVGSGLKGYYTTNRERDKVYKVHIYGLYGLFAANGGGKYKYPTLTFGGNQLSIFHNGNQVYSAKAYSGVPLENGEFDYSVARQKMSGVVTVNHYTGVAQMIL